MPGAFAHLAAVNVAAANTALSKLTTPLLAKKTLSQNKKFIELGCVGPDYPYLALMNSAQNRWADEMHYNNVGQLITELIGQVKRLQDKEQRIAFAWLCGFVAHVATDITVHPVVELKVGPYAENAKKHRICEMHQDAHIWPLRMGLGDIGYADRVRENIGSCVDKADNTAIEPIIKNIWSVALQKVYPEYAAQCQPDINAWHKGFQLVVDNVEEGHKLFAWARHVASAHGLTYPLATEVDSEFIDSLETPAGLMHYDDIFDKAVRTIHIFWEHTAHAVFEDGATTFFKHWNLDTGRCENGQLTAWNKL